jgi:hypothetical protein
MIKLLLAAAVAATPVVDQEQKNCVEPEALSAAMMLAIPDVLNNAAEQCRPMLSDKAFLGTRSSALAERIKHDMGDGSAAIGALLKGLKGINLPKSVKPEAMAPLFTAMMADEIGKQIGKLDARSCAGLDRLVAALEPMPTENITQLIAGILILGGKKDKDLNLCPAA